MKRNCNLELRLVSSSIDDEFEHDSDDHPRNHVGYDQEQQLKQQITIFYGGRVCVCDVTELQARAILSLARREMEDRVTTPEGSSSSPKSLPSHQIYSTGNGLSMTRSLQRFLQKRKTRIQATSPYNIGQSRRGGVLNTLMC